MKRKAKTIIEPILKGAPSRINEITLTPNGGIGPLHVKITDRFWNFREALDTWIKAWLSSRSVDELEPGYADELIDMELGLAETDALRQYKSGIEGGARELKAAQSATLGRVKQEAGYSDKRLLGLEREALKLYRLMNKADGLEFLDDDGAVGGDAPDTGNIN